MNKNQKIILITISVALIGLMFFQFSNEFALADDTIRDLELDYPEIPEAETPGEDLSGERTTLPEYVKYLFNFGIAIAGILAFVVLVFGGFLWMTSAGDPAAIGKAKSKMFGGIIGLFLIFGSYLIIHRINPDLISLKDLPDMLPTTGIYLCETEADCKINDSNKRKRYSGNIPKFPDSGGFNAKKACFISKKDELMSLFVHSTEGFQGTITQEIKNTKTQDESECCGNFCGDITTGKSLSFLWNNSGVYLYEKENFVVEGGSKIPEHLLGSAKTLKKWDNITKSIKVIHPSKNAAIMGYLFDESDFKGKCFHFAEKALDDVKDGKTVTEINPLHSNVANSLSSIYAFTYTFGSAAKGEVVFFDEQNCDGNRFSVKIDDDEVIKGGDFGGYEFRDRQGNAIEGYSAGGRVKSLEINGPFNVLITTQEAWSAPDIECEIFIKPYDTNCYSSIVSSNVYSENNENIRPISFLIVPAD